MFEINSAEGGTEMKKAWKALDILKDVDTGVSGSDALNIIEQALTELEELKRDAKRFSKLVSKPTWLTAVESANYDYLKDKLLKVGKKE